MRKSNGIRRANTFLIEIIIVLLFFSLSISVALNFFVDAHNKQVRSEQMTNFLFICQTLITNTIDSDDEFIGEDILNNAYDSHITQENATAVFYYDKQFNLLKEQGYYRVELNIQHDSNNFGTLSTVSVSAYVVAGDHIKEEKLINLTTEKYYN